MREYADINRDNHGSDGATIITDSTCWRFYRSNQLQIFFSPVQCSIPNRGLIISLPEKIIKYESEGVKIATFQKKNANIIVAIAGVHGVL